MPPSDFDPLAPQDPGKTIDLHGGSSVDDDAGNILNIEAVVTPVQPLPPIGGPAPASRFALKDEVGRGGMGEVHSCDDAHLGRDVVAKILHAKYVDRPEAVARFREEIRLTGQLEHPGIVPVYEAGVTADGRPYFVMQRVWGLTLRQLLDERATPADGRSRLLKVFEQVCHTVAYAHAQRVIHRDLNPSNVMVGLFGQVKVMDWGLAKSLDGRARPITLVGEAEPPAEARQTQAGSVMGTPAYMPPEQAAGEVDKLDERCDVFGLGAVLCEILTGRPPYVSSDPKKLLRLAAKARLSAALARLDGSHADPDLVALTKACLAADRDQRPRDAGAVADRLARYFDTVLRQAEWDLVRFFDLSLDLFCIAGFDGHFRRINGNFARVLGQPTADLLAHPFVSFVHPDDHARTGEVMSRLKDNQPVAGFRNRYRDAAGRYRWFEWSAKAVPEDDVIFAVARDVTREVELEERLKALEAAAAPPQ